MDVTDVSSGSASKLLNLLRNGASVFTVDKTGAVYVTGPIWQKHGTFHRVIVGTPNGGRYYSSGNQTGAIEIKLPAGIIQAWVMLTVDIGQLTTNAHSVLRISGYIWQAPGGTAWSGVSVTNETGDPVRDLTVRFGDDGTTHVIWIGELAAAWYHPTVVVRDVTFTDAYYEPAVDHANGWTVGLQATAFGTVGITDTENLPFAKGLSYGGTDVVTTSSAAAKLADNVSAYFGTGYDLRVYHDGTNSHIRNVTGTQYVSGDTITLRSVTGAEKFIECFVNGYTALYWDNQVRLWTGSNTITFVGGAKLQELSASPTATAAYGISWVLDETPNRPMFTDDAGGEFRYQILPSTGPQVYSGSGSPEGAKTAAVGSLYMRTDGGAGTSLYVKESGAGNTGWVAK